MGATLSHLGCASHPPLAPSPVPNLNLNNGDVVSPSIIDLCTRLVTLERDLQFFRASNKNKEAVIEYLLQANVSNYGFKVMNSQLERQLILLRTIVDRTNSEKEEIKEKLRKAEEAVVALSTHSIPTSQPVSTSTSFSSNTIVPEGEAVTEDLIDLRACSQDLDSAKLVEEDDNLPGELCHDKPDIEGTSPRNTTLDHSLYRYHNSGVQEPSYVIYFADSDEESNSNAGVTAEHIAVPHKTFDVVTPPSEVGAYVISSTESSGCSPPNSWSPSRHVSKSPTPISSTKRKASLKLASTNIQEIPGQFEDSTLTENTDGSLKRCAPLEENVAWALPSLNTYEQVQSSSPGSCKLQVLPEKVGRTENETRSSAPEAVSSPQEHESAASINHSNGPPNELRYSVPFEYGIYFSPSDSERDVYRTIIVSNLQPDISLGTLLNYVRGGPVIDAKLLDTVKITGKKSALITFLHEYEAMAFEDYTKSSPVVINGVKAQVQVVSTPTWPTTIPIRKAIFDHHHTRCLKVVNFPQQISPHTLRADLDLCKPIDYNPITHMHKGNDDILELQFSSVAWAGHAYGMLSSYRAYRDCTPHFAPDPCAQPLETLKAQQLTCTTGAQSVNKHTTTVPAVKPVAVDESGRLAKVE